MDDGLRAEGADAADRLHNLLLAMTGRVDDDAINAAREMLGTGHVDAAGEFLAGCLLAGRIPVTSTEQYHLRRVLDEARSQHTLADRLNVVDSVPSEQHKFSDQHESDADLVTALAPVTARLTGVRAVWCAWRETPAGVTYGAVPRRVVLAEVGSDGSVSAVGYQLLEALRRAGIGCSVDVFNSGSDLPEYHRSALASARRVHLDVPAAPVSQNGSNRARAPRASSAAEPARSEPVIGAESPSPPEREAAVEQTAVIPQIPAVDAAPELSSAEKTPAVETPAMEAPAMEAPTVETPAVETPAVLKTAVESDSPHDEADGQAKDQKNMRVPAAVDAKLTDRERNLLRKLHEELAQREQGSDEHAVPSRSSQQDTNSTPKGTGGFPPIHKS